jgi:undecaprenyl-diphosphatase
MRIALAESFAGAVLLGAAAWVGLSFVHRPSLDHLDRLAFAHIAPAGGESLAWFHLVTDIGSRPVLIVGLLIAGLVGAFRDWMRALACVIGPLLAVAITENIAKPLVGGHGVGFGGDSYPSGTVTAVAALCTVVVLALPYRLRMVSLPLAAGIVVLAGYSVIALRWHFATDVVGGVLVGTGAPLLLDGLAHLVPHRSRAGRSGRRAPLTPSVSKTGAHAA